MTDSEYGIDLIDEGTMDTVVDVYHPRWDEPKTFRYSDTSDYRDEAGCLDLKTFAEKVVIPDAEQEE